MICQICGQEMKQIPAGVSKKTGKSYNAFMACPNKCNQPKVWEQRPTNQPVVQQANVQARIDKAIAEKKDSIAWMNAKNNATLLWANGKIGENEFVEKLNWIYSLEPNKEPEYQEPNIDEPPF